VEFHHARDIHIHGIINRGARSRNAVFRSAIKWYADGNSKRRESVIARGGALLMMIETIWGLAPRHLLRWQKSMPLVTGVEVIHRPYPSVTVIVIACGGQWLSGTRRLAIEDFLKAGAILSERDPAELSRESQTAVGAYRGRS